MPTYRIPYRWEMADECLVEAASLEAAIEMIDSGRFDASIACGSYIDGSFDVDREMAEYHAGAEEMKEKEEQGSADPLEA